MAIKCEEYNQVCVMSVEGDFAADQLAAARKAFDQRVDERQIVDFVIDFEKSPFIDSEGLELLLTMKRRSEELFGQFKIAALDENLRKIMEITRLDHKFECHKDLTAALKTMR